ncbi:hypothetical protein ACHAW5_008796 [Stephanodiscus triporus]|uniref:Uncharacterized protein n=1 Tax=Stephanodiscus triporus TaxID=2934178 RepID=A0ABD3MTG3_9STRA
MTYSASLLRALVAASAALMAASSSSSSSVSSVPEVATVDMSMMLVSSFNEWATKFEREYADAGERERRWLVWLENHVLIESHNAKEGKSFMLGHNEYSDMTHAEFRERMRLGEFSRGLPPSGQKRRGFNFMEYDGGEKGEEEEAKKGLRGPSSATGGGGEADPAAVVAAVGRRRALAVDGEEDAGCDWHAEGLTGPVRQQGQCGACWAFSAIGAIESAMAIKKYRALPPPEREALAGRSSGDLGLVVPLSEQDLIDCDLRFEKGCEGGLMTTTFEEEETSRSGICSEVDYPYLETEGTCSRNMCTPVEGSIVTNQVDVQPRKTNALKEALKVQPVTAAMVANDPMFQFYSSGIYQMEGCGRVTEEMGSPDCGILYEDQDVCLPNINHGVLVVGYGTDEEATTDVKGFFKVKNSWGTTWGEGGFFRLARWETDKTDPMDNWGECAILSLLSYPVME